MPLFLDNQKYPRRADCRFFCSIWWDPSVFERYMSVVSNKHRKWNTATKIYNMNVENENTPGWLQLESIFKKKASLWFWGELKSFSKEENHLLKCFLSKFKSLSELNRFFSCSSPLPIGRQRVFSLKSKQNFWHSNFYKGFTCNCII